MKNNNTLAELKASFDAEISKIKYAVQKEVSHYISDLSLSGLSSEKQTEKQTEKQSLREDFEDSDPCI